MTATLIDADKIWLGASWYPEMWPETEWPLDIARMRDIGFTIVRAFEFAWHRFEPREGEYDFTWARRVMDLCHEAGLPVMVGTPTAAPPAWLAANYPETLMTRVDGSRHTHGVRRHYSPFSDKYRELSRRIVEEMVNALGDHPALCAWQIDNEINGHDHSESTRAQFQAWLRDHFESIEAMNSAWGLEFWSQAYNSFDQIPLPICSLGPGEWTRAHHPSLTLAASRFQTEGWDRFIAEQCEIIRAQSSKPICHNMCGHAQTLDWFRLNQGLDRVGYSLYPEAPVYPRTIMSFDRMRAEKPAPYWLLETAPNWAGGLTRWNVHHRGDAMRAFCWLSVALGGEMVLYWQWRQHWAGQEMQHGTCVAATGQWCPNHEHWRLLADEFSSHGAWLQAHPPAPARVALMMSTEAGWQLTVNEPDDSAPPYETLWRDSFHQPLRRAHIWRDVIGPEADLAPYKVLLLPLLPVLDAALRQRLDSWVRDGGLLLLGPYTGHRTEEFTCFTDRRFGGLEELIGADSDISFSTMWREGKTQVELTDGPAGAASYWCEAFRPAAGTAIGWYRGAGEYGDGRVAVIDHRVGAGRVITLGAIVPEEILLHLAGLLFEEAGVAPVAQGSVDVAVMPRAAANSNVAGYAIVNLAEETREIVLPCSGRDLLTGQQVAATLRLAPFGVGLIEA